MSLNFKNDSDVNYLIEDISDFLISFADSFVLRILLAQNENLIWVYSNLYLEIGLKDML